LAIINIQHALVVAAQAGHIKVIEILLDFGAQVNFYRGHLKNPLPKRRIRFHSIRFQVPIDNPPLFTAVQYGHVEVVGNLLARGADPQLYTPLPLYRAVEDGRRDIISLLLKLDVRSQKAALKLAVLQEDCSMVQFLLCGVEAPENGNAGLFVAEMKGFKDIVSLLKTHGVSIDALDECDKDDWEKEDGDGAVRFHYYMKPQQCMGDQAGIDEDSDESELDN
jgi:ankyrin repeat protein